MFVLALALAGAGCDWRKFDDLKKTTPVAAISAPSNYPANGDFGPNLLAVPPPSDGSAAGRFVAAATYSTSVAVVSFDAAGSPSGVGVTGMAFDALAGGTDRVDRPGARQAAGVARGAHGRGSATCC